MVVGSDNDLSAKVIWYLVLITKLQKKLVSVYAILGFQASGFVV